MKIKKILSFVLCAAMLFSAFPPVSLAEDDKAERTVYLHAQGLEPPKPAVNSTTVYMGENADIYLAIDNPNKGDYENGVHNEPQYDLNGYTAKIYFDPAYFDYAASSTAQPIDYKVPDSNIVESGSTSEDTAGGEVTAPERVGYYTYRHGSTTENVNGKSYKTAYITVFFSGTYLPQMKAGQNWYNLLKLPLKPLKTGNTEVFVDVDGYDDCVLELFAKNKKDEYEEQFFKYSAVNGGRHTILIRDRLKPAPPAAEPNAGRYSDKQSVALTAEENCDIYYSTDGVNYVLYTAPIEVELTTEISCYAQRKSDGKTSNTVSFKYEIVPKAPFLFDSKSELIPNSYTADNAFSVFAADKNVFGNIDDSSEVYYTFARLDETAPLDGSDPYTEWVKVNKSTQRIDITKNVTMRLITSKMGELSDISEYYLGIRPTKPEANYESGIYKQKIDLELTSKTTGAKIYYTLDGSDPISNGIEYDNEKPITLAVDTVIRAVAVYDGKYSDVSSYQYIFDFYDDYGVTAFYPSGVYEGSVDVTLTPNNPENEIEYSTDGGKTWQKGDTLHIDRDTDILAVSVDKDGKRGDEYSFTYKIKPIPPAFAPESTQFTNADKITVYCVESTKDNTERYELFYTLDGSDPTESSTRIKANDESDTAIIEINKYTQVKAVVYKDGERYSNVVTHSYDIVKMKPVKPITTLLPGYYTREIGDTKGFSTQLMPVPAGTEIYYSVSYDSSFLPDPVPSAENKYTPDEEIEVKGKTTIKAVAVNVFGVKSDVGIFEYTVIPEAPKAAPSAKIYGEYLPKVPVSTVEGSTVTYTINGGEPVVIENCPESFEIDLKDFGGSAELEIYASLDGADSYKNKYVYSLTDDKSYLAPPYADKATGEYEEMKVDEENNLLYVSLYSLNTVGDIEYRLNNEGEWITYDGKPLKLKNDTVLQARSVNGENVSTVASYVYNFVPLAPVITLPSGRYADSTVWQTFIELDSSVPEDKEYSIFYRRNGDFLDVRYQLGTPCDIDHTMSFKAYVKNEKTGRLSKNTINYYIIESENAAKGTVYIANPYDASRISAHILDKGEYANGIKLLSQNKDAKIHYYYTYTKTDGTQATTNNLVYDAAAPIMVNDSFENIKIVAWLEDGNGKIEGSDYSHTIDFIHLNIPQTSLGTEKTEYPKGTQYTLINEYKDDSNIILYYTLDKTDPTDKANTNRKIYSDETLSVNGETNIYAVYYSACGKCAACKNDDKENCWYGVYGESGKYRYTNPTVITTGGGSGGGGGTHTVDKTRKYTKDIFGNEHPTHIGYINGYPDGSVQPDGNITREEMTSILYRIKNKEYEAPFIPTGDVFPDVNSGRWSLNDIEYMADKKVVEGYPDGEFKPERNLTRAEFSALIRRFTGLTKPADKNIFPDLEESHWAYKDILMLTEAGLLQGYEDGTIRPERPISRAEVMTVVNKILGRCPDDAYVKGLNFNPYNDLDKNAWHYVTVLEATITHDYYLNDKESLEIKWENWK